METEKFRKLKTINLFLSRIKPKLTFDPTQEAFKMWENNNEEDLMDFTILSVEGTRFPCHRLILATQRAAAATRPWFAITVNHKMIQPKPEDFP